ncbi:MAG: acetylornithine deacetylase [Gammaproteobacteria bacterium]|nr:acetylornithine deacetylase [Gammaproteobacteria bacterium]
MTSVLPNTGEMIARLVGTPSVSSVDPALDMGNRAVCELIAEWAEALGFRIEWLPIPDHPDKVNLIATLGDGPGGLVLSGHTDTVPYDTTRWRSDPFVVESRDDRLYGLGTADMKGFFAVALAAAERFASGKLRQPLVLLATADEESGMCGARELLAAGRPRASLALIGEPTGLAPVRMHKGVLMEGIRLVGRSGHSSNPALGNNAIEGMHEVIGELMAWRRELASEWTNPAFEIPGPTLNLGHIHGGDNPNRICGECELRIDLRPLPGMDLDALRDTLRERLATRLEGSGLVLEVESLFPGLPGMETAPDSPMVRLAESLTGQRAEAVPFATEGPFLQQLGLDTVVLGPGGIGQAHQPDEYIELDQVRRGVELLSGLIASSCTET